MTSRPPRPFLPRRGVTPTPFRAIVPDSDPELARTGEYEIPPLPPIRVPTRTEHRATRPTLRPKRKAPHK